MSVAWSADQRRALSGSADKTVRLWDVETGRCLRVLEGHTDGVLSVAWSADQRRALSGAMTRPCGCGTWRRGAACASSKAIRIRLERGVERRSTPRPLRLR